LLAPSLEEVAEFSVWPEPVAAPVWLQVSELVQAWLVQVLEQASLSPE
jgi:hypothetical protein